jgi:hypothetical protein
MLMLGLCLKIIVGERSWFCKEILRIYFLQDIAIFKSVLLV